MSKERLQPVIAITNAKGGAGKSTLACCLAAELTRRGRTVTLIDADPKRGTQAWHAAGGPLQALRLLVEPSDSVAAVARSAASTSTVFIDAKVFTTSTLVSVLEAADLVLVPCRASERDATRAIETVQMTLEVARATGRSVPVYVVLNAVTKIAGVPHFRAQLEAAGVTVLAAEIGNRTVFGVAASNGTAPCWMGPAADTAAAEVAAVADELDIYNKVSGQQ